MQKLQQLSLFLVFLRLHDPCRLISRIPGGAFLEINLGQKNPGVQRGLNHIALKREYYEESVLH